MAVASARRWRRGALRLDGLQTDPAHPTGEVRIELKDGEPTYDICMPRAWDFVADDGFRATKLLYHGLLALRSEPSRCAFEAIAARSEAIRFFDINLRPPHDSPDLLQMWMQGADWLKLNLDELAAVLGGKKISFADSEASMDRLRDTFGIRNVLLTAGAEGLRIRGEYGEAVCSPAPPLAEAGGHRGRGRFDFGRGHRRHPARRARAGDRERRRPVCFEDLRIAWGHHRGKGVLSP